MAIANDRPCARRPYSPIAVLVVVVVSMIALVSAAPALAESPWWHLTSAARPSILPTAGEGTVVVSASNLSATEIDGSSEAVRLTDTLPAGLSVISVRGVAGLLGRGGSECSSSTVGGSAVVLCTTEGKLPPYELFEVRIRVKVEGAVSGALNRMSISGGGAPSLSASRPVAIGSGGTPFGLEQYEFTPENADGSPATQAGAHPFQLTDTLFLNSGAEPEAGRVLPPAMVKDLRFKVPPGLVGNPIPFPQCTATQFSPTGAFLNGCPTDTQIGVARVTFYEPSFFGLSTVVAPLYNLVPARGEPARFGFISVLFPVVLETSIRTGGDYGVTVTVPNITEVPAFLASQVTFWGDPGDPRHNHARGGDCLGGGLILGEGCTDPGDAVGAPFLTMPSLCGNPLTEPLESSVTADPWTDPSTVTEPAVYKWHDGAGTPLALDGCNKLGFEPSISVAPDGQNASTPTGLTVGLHVPQEEILTPKGLAQSDVKDTTVTLPEGVQLSPAAADGLSSCSLEQVSLATAGSPSCPEASKVGTVEVKTPLLSEPLEGAVYLAAQNANPFGLLVALYVVAEDPTAGVVVKFAGKVAPDPVTGQLVSTFENTPPLPFSDLKLHFFGSARAPLSTPALCGNYMTTTSITPSSGGASAEPSSSFDITSGPNGGPCASPLPFAPSLTAGTTSNQAGGLSPFTMTMSREDGQQNLKAIALHMPPGLSGTLTGVPLCGEAQANAGTCGSGSLIGHTTVSVGLGGDPFTVTGGQVFLTGPYKGAPFGLSIVNPAKAGPFDLGQVIVRAKIEVDPHTAALTITSDSSGPYAIPPILDGIPLQIKHINVSIDRPEFTFNPTNCDKLAITGSLSSTEGATSALSVPFQVTNCAALAFKPKLAVSTAGKTSKANGASLGVKLTYPLGPFDANIKSVKVDLPKQLPSRLTTLQKACTAAQFESNPAGCPTASIVGHAKALTPIIPVPLEGPAYFVSHGGEAFPSLIVVLQGYGVTVDLVGTTFISKAGITSSTFKTVPDVPVGSFELTLPQGKYSALAANGNLCKTKLAMPTAFVAQNGAKINESTKIAVTGCPKAKKAKAKHRKKQERAGRKAAGQR